MSSVAVLMLLLDVIFANNSKGCTLPPHFSLPGNGVSAGTVLNVNRSGKYTWARGAAIWRQATIVAI